MYMLLFFLCMTAVPVLHGKEFPALDVLRSKTPAADQADAVKLLIQRFVGKRAAEFDVAVTLTNSSYLDNYEVTSNGSTISIKANTGVAAARGFYYVLTDLFGGHISWSGNRIHLPDPGKLPVIKSGQVNVTSPQRFRYYQNVCTASYSFTWWNWTRWEQEIDWMALNGFNLPLAFNGQEAIWQKVYLKMGLTQEDLDKHFGGPAFLAWARMGNIRAWGGPLPQSWLDSDLALQKQILRRMKSFGMIPVLPGFAGHVPGGFKRVFPNAHVSQLSPWGHFTCNLSCTYFLDPTDPLFKTVGAAFIKMQEEEYGDLDHIYNADTFNEMTPVSRAGYSDLHSGPATDERLSSSSPEGRMIVLDLAAETVPIYVSPKSFYGQPFIWCMLHNFGGNHGLYGRMDAVNKGPFEAMLFEGSTMVGMGTTPEGIEQNDFIYNFFNSLTFRGDHLNVPEWVGNYSRNRYGVSNEDINNAWQLLSTTIYNCLDTHSDHNHGIPVQRPSLKLAPNVWYDWRSVGKAWKSLLRAANQCSGSDLFRYDLVDVTRQVLHDISLECYQNLTAAYDNWNLDEVKVYGERLLEVIQDMDNITSSHSKWLLGNWLEAAKRAGKNDDEKKLYEYNARNQITLWGPSGNILDYGNKEWGGLLGSYYYSRWRLFANYIQDCVYSHTKFDRTTFNNMSLQVESNWTFARDLYPTVPQGDSVSISSSLYMKYKSFIEWTNKKPTLVNSVKSPGRLFSAYSYQNIGTDKEDGQGESLLI
ncbi:putative alpha-N-acetylglucosaminidase isoform X2 [Apostichopus japonicus]|uniref:Putative alpha-N-acetylglucosaminidase isoform X2 n=1 Tax=Stichopus japonicus TaxID=307972 RepID=A0A2G8LHJ0_STIJA|nr:putative alpha-N-acetylglucosaminidase isoform X2 [Apostichopus japonicus]